MEQSTPSKPFIHSGYLSAKHAMQLLDISEPSFYKLLREQPIKKYYLAGKAMYKVTDLEKWITDTPSESKRFDRGSRTENPISRTTQSKTKVKGKVVNAHVNTRSKEVGKSVNLVVNSRR